MEQKIDKLGRHGSEGPDIGLTLEALEEIGTLTHEIVEWVAVLELLAVTRATLTVAGVRLLLLVAKVHLRSWTNKLIK